ncbi:hypothetical protein GLAREA_06082 [Glarea lozoyensis ATCC 20868]|uniref:Uncharacterized protein n=1 Tax=Glarea lozoyensis (strain ATCC 20868 / MF5171) TaxID=1116229 RepID=S3D5M9_GLAL2|nr:uncharacterized protein GLAREA_06082 [Glarea lozoyensis ATCC 20868]EPE33070.1 hypothetical protein GLAREA_06082 [Glarea lozoyensis ATCC 20868]
MSGSQHTLEFIEEDPGADKRKRSRKAVRSHVARGYHRERRETETRRFQQNHQIRPLSQQLVTNQSNEFRKLSESAQGLFHVKPALVYNDNLIPYTFFSSNGPMLELPYGSQPFYNATSREQYSPGVFPRQSIWMPNATVPDIVKIKGPILDLEVVDWISNTPNCFQYRAETIRWIHKRLANLQTAKEDDTLGAIMTLAMWESYKVKVDPTDLVTHMNGLEQLIRLRGGLHTMQSSLALKLAHFDHIIGAVTLREPRFPLHSRAAFCVLPWSQKCFHDSPLNGSTPFALFIANTGADEKIAALLTSLRQLTGEAEAGTLSAKELKLPSFGDSQNPIYDIISYASHIFLPALYSPTPGAIFSSGLSGSYLQAISRNLQSTSSSEFASRPPCPIILLAAPNDCSH